MMSQQSLSLLLRQMQQNQILMEASGGQSSSEDGGAEKDASTSQVPPISEFDVLDQTQVQDQWTEEMLVEEVRQCRCLWNTSCTAYKDGMKKQQAWREISAKFAAPEEILKKTWKNLRDGLSKCLKKRDLMTRSGASAGKLPRCKLFDQLLFIRDTVSNRQSVSNVSIEGSPVADSDLFTSPGSPYDRSSSSISNSSMESSNIPPKKIKKRSFDECDALLIDALKNDSSTSEKKSVVDQDVSFTESIVPILRSLAPKKNRLAKIEIQQLLLKYEFDED